MFKLVSHCETQKQISPECLFFAKVPVERKRETYFDKLNIHELFQGNPAI